ncbi:signal recognition particle receptor subunit alpha [Tremella mesenterica]|uniref:Signal recognition particle receptor subunit alpha n=1 Tax=Tremella mesenterica TaxID=5217 RepID=A0A4Q1BV39_TREME|nr:signal recognition particle receptor subunit alpha [Tremella mesenterica]
MLDHISISHQNSTGGLVLWSKSFTPAFSTLVTSTASPINALVREGFIENRLTEETGYEKDGYSVRWTMENGLGLVFVVVFPALLPLAYIPQLLARTKQLFLSLFQTYLQGLIDSLNSGSAIVEHISQSALRLLQTQLEIQQWGRIFDRCLKDCESQDTVGFSYHTLRSTHSSCLSDSVVETYFTNTYHLIQRDTSSCPGLSDESSTPVTAEEISKNVQAIKSKLKARKPRGGRESAVSSSPSRKTPSSAGAKLMRKWGDSVVSAEDMASFDYSAPAPTTNGHSDAPAVKTDDLISTAAMGTRNKQGTYEVADWDLGRSELPTEEEILARVTGKLKITDEVEKKVGWGDMLNRLTGKKILTEEDLRPVLREMEKHLMGKNVAKDIAEKMCEGVGAALVGKRLGGLTSIRSQVQSSLSDSLTRVLTPRTSTDILLEIQRKRSALTSLSTSPGPYTLTFVGVNGVGKSTNLSKVCFWLLQNGLRVLIAACDTFRSGAVEQLRVHVRNLGALGDEMGLAGEGGKKVELFERGYGKDAAGIAKDAISYAKEQGFDVVLIDTAGRMQDNEPLMRALAKLVSVNDPDKIIFVGEALVGNEAVDQLTKFDRALKDFSAAGIGGTQRKRGIDGIILTKFDTIDDKVGAALSMTYVTGQPILFVGCGQTYTDLRQLRVNHIVQALLSS